MAPEFLQRVFEDPAALAAGAADLIAETLVGAITARGAASLVLAGGTTPVASYRALATARVDWARVAFFWGDERCVPPDDSASNYRMAREALLDPADVPLSSVHRIAGERPAADAAAGYERTLRQRFADTLPRFDLVLLGVGEDGHVASLFPGRPVPPEGRWVLAVEPPTEGPDRVSLSPAALAAARCICLLVSGAHKAAIVRRVLSGAAGELPAAAVAGRAERVIWMLDRSAAGQLV